MRKSSHVIAALCVAVVGLFAALTAHGGQTATLTKDRIPKNKPVVPGYWHAGLKECQAYAKANNVPLIAVWSNGDVCGHCLNFESAVNNKTFVKWRKESGCVFYFVHSGDKNSATADNGAQKAAGYNFCDGGRHLSQFPFVRVWWYVNGKKKVDVAVTGDTVDGGFGGGTGASKSVKWITKQIKGFTPVTKPKYTGGTFGVGDVEGARLEAVPNVTTWVDVPIVRTNATAAAVVSTNTLQVVYPNGKPEKREVIYWSAGESKTNITVDVSGINSTSTPIKLILLDAADAGVATNHITLVAEPENSPSNPLKVGEKASADLAWGEWTMDLDVALQKVRDYNSGTSQTTSGGGASLLTAASPKNRAYTLLMTAGCLWCPDCKKTDANLIMQNQFKTWAQENKVALVTLDLPTGDSSSVTPTLLTDVPYTADKAKAYYGMSGVSYLSRKMITKEEGEAVLARNWELAQKLRLPNWPNKDRPPVPSFFVLRDDGTVAGRIQYFGWVSSPSNTANIAAHIKRLNELLLQVDDPVEESNDNPFWTTESIGLRSVVGTNEVKSISFADSTDVYKLDPETTYGKRMSFTLTGETDARVQLRLIRVIGEDSYEVAAASEVLSSNVTLSATVPTTNCYISVNYEMDAKFAPTTTYFSVTSAGSTVCPYALATDFVVEPTDIAAENHVVIEDGVNQVTVNLVSNQLYRITNLQANEALEPAVGTTDNLYLSKVDGDVRLDLTAGESYIQKWNPGKVGFVSQRASVAESTPSYNIRVARSGGASGRATAQVKFKSALYPDLIEGGETFSAEELVWEEGDTEIKTVKVNLVENTFADGDQPVVFDATLGGDAEEGIKEFTLTVRDNDKAMSGKIAIVATTPAMAKAMTVFARAESDVTLSLERVDGATGPQNVTLAVNDPTATLDASDLSWKNRKADAQEVHLTLPSSGKAVKVTLTPQKGSFVDSARRILTVNLLDKDAPGFETDAKSVDATRYVPMPETRIALDGKATDQTVVKKYSGALPSGVKWSFDKDAKELVLAGIPANAGTFTSVFRASTGSVQGLTVAVTITVTDPVLKGGGADGGQPLNAAVENSRTLPDIPVLFAGTNRLAGVLTLTLPRTGRASAKFRSIEYGDVSFASASWDAIGGDGTLTVTLTGKAGSETKTIVATVAADGTVGVDLGPDYTCILPGTTWSAANPATDFKGYYTVNLHPIAKAGTVLAAGDGYLALKMNTAAAINIGKFTYAGVLPNGQTVTGSAVLSAADRSDPSLGEFWMRGLLPVVLPSSTDAVAGLAQLTPGAWDPTATTMVENGLSTGRSYYQSIRRSVRPAAEAEFLWYHTDKTADTSGETVFDVNGTYYVQTENFAGCCVTSIGTSALKFFLLDGVNDVPPAVLDSLGVESVDIGTWSMPGVKVTSTATNKKKTAWKNALASQAKALTLNFKPETGVVSGSFTVGGVKMTYAGIVMPGWGAQGCDSCAPGAGAGGTEAAGRPFVSGAAWFGDTFDYTDGAGRSRTAKVKRSLPFTIGVEAGQ